MGPASINIQMVRENLALSIALWAAAQRGVITAASVPAKTAFKALSSEFIEVDSPLELSDNRDLVRCVSNQIRSAFAFSAIQTYRSLETTYRGSPLQESDPDLRGARCSFYVLNKTVAQNLLSPVWNCPPEYRSRFDVRDVPFSLDASDLDGKEVYWEDFGGLQRYLSLLEFCCLRVAEDSPESMPESLNEPRAPAGGGGAVTVPAKHAHEKSAHAKNGKVSTLADVPAFLADCCLAGNDAKVIAKGLYQAYINWCRERGEEPLAQRSFGMQLTAHGFQRQRRGKGRHWWMGVTLVSP